MAIKEATWSVPGRNLHSVVLYHSDVEEGIIGARRQSVGQGGSGEMSVAIRVASREASTCPGIDEGGNQWGK